jgi:hypothetical protein
MIKLTSLLKEVINLLRENTNDIITNYTKEKESEKAVMVVIPYVTNKGDEKSLKMWVPKSILDKNNGIPKWILSNHLKDLAQKGIKYDAKNILNTAGKSLSDLPQLRKPEYVEVWDYAVDPQSMPDRFHNDKHKQFHASEFTREIKKNNTQQEAQKAINKILTYPGVSEWKKVPLLIWKKKVTKDEANKMIDPHLFDNVTIKYINEKRI